MEKLDEDDEWGGGGEKGEDEEAGSVAEDADDKSGAPAEFGEDFAENEHREDFGDLAQAHDDGGPCGVDLGGGQGFADESAGHDKITVMDGGINEGGNEEDEDGRDGEEFASFQPSETVRTSAFVRWRMGQSEAEDGENDAGHAGDQEDASGGIDDFAGGFSVQDVSNRPCRKNPADGATHADKAEFLVSALHVGEGDGVRNGNGRHVKQTVQGHEGKEDPEGGVPKGRNHGTRLYGDGAGEFYKSQSGNGEAPDKVAERHEFFGRKVPVGKLIAEEHADDGGYGEGAQDEFLFGLGKSHGGEISENERQPCPPDEEF